MIRRGEVMLTPLPCVGASELAAEAAEGTTGREGAQQHRPQG